MNKILRISMIAVLALIANFSFADTYTYNFESKQFGKSGDTKDLGGITWSIKTDAGYFGFDGNNNKGQQFGSKKKPATELTLTTKDIPGKISSIKVTTAGAAGIDATLDVTVGGKNFGNQYKMVFDLTTATFTGSEEGDIVLSYSNSSACAIYISSIEIVTDGKIESKPEEVKTAANIAEFKSFSTGTKAVLTLKNAKVQYVNGTSDYYIADETGGIDIFKPTGLTYTAGQVLNGTITATYDEYCKLPELTKIEENNLTATEGTIEPIEMTIAEAAKIENACKLIKITNVKAVEDGGKFYTDAEKTLQFFDKFSIGYTIDTENANDYTGIIIPFNSIMEFAPIAKPVTTGINNITTDATLENAPAFNLAGQKVGKAYKGVVIKAGKKFVQK